MKADFGFLQLLLKPQLFKDPAFSAFRPPTGVSFGLSKEKKIKEKPAKHSSLSSTF